MKLKTDKGGKRHSVAHQREKKTEVFAQIMCKLPSENPAALFILRYLQLLCCYHIYYKIKKIYHKMQSGSDIRPTLLLHLFFLLPVCAFY